MNVVWQNDLNLEYEQKFVKVYLYIPVRLGSNQMVSHHAPQAFFSKTLCCISWFKVTCWEDGCFQSISCAEKELQGTFRNAASGQVDKPRVWWILEFRWFLIEHLRLFHKRAQKRRGQGHAYRSSSLHETRSFCVSKIFCNPSLSSNLGNFQHSSLI